MSDRIYTHKDEAVRLFFTQCKLSLNMAEQLVTEHTPMLINRRFITDAQLSENLNISRRTLQDYRDRGIIPFYRLDGKILYDEADIDKFLSERYRPKYED